MVQTIFALKICCLFSLVNIQYHEVPSLQRLIFIELANLGYFKVSHISPRQTFGGSKILILVVQLLLKFIVFPLAEV